MGAANLSVFVHVHNTFLWENLNEIGYCYRVSYYTNVVYCEIPANFIFEGNSILR